MAQIYGNTFKYKTDIDLLSLVIRIFSIVKLDDDLENHQERVLMFYIKYGYSPDTKDKIISSLGIKRHYLNTINHHLDKKGYLIKDNNNRQKKHLSAELQQLREAWVDNKVDVYAIKFVKDNA